MFILQLHNCCENKIKPKSFVKKKIKILRRIFFEYFPIVLCFHNIKNIFVSPVIHLIASIILKYTISMPRSNNNSTVFYTLEMLKSFSSITNDIINFRFSCFLFSLSLHNFFAFQSDNRSTQSRHELVI